MGKNRWVIAIGITVVCLAAIFLAYFVITKPAPPHPAPSSSSTPTVADTVVMLMSRGKVAFPAIVGVSTSTPAKLPQDVQMVFKQSLNVMTVSSLRYRDGRTGFLASVWVTSALSDFYDHVIRGLGVAGWTPLFAARASSAAIYQAENTAYTMQILFTGVDQSYVRADIQMIGRP